MKTTTVFAALAGTVAAQGVTDKITPTGAAPAGCSASYDGQFMVTVAKVSAKRDTFDLTARAECGGEGTLVSTLKDGVQLDAFGRTAYIAANYQYQFDKPAQTGAIYTAGFSACSNGTLALGSSTTFYACVSGDFSNLYDRNWAPQCSQVEILIIPCGKADASASQLGDGQVVGTQIVTTTIVKPLSDGQPQVRTTTVPIPLCQINDGQAQAKTTPCASITAKATPTNLPPPVSQYSDGQIQVTAPAAVPTVAPPVSQYTDGQVQVTGTAVKSSASVPAASASASSAKTSAATAPAVTASSAASSSSATAKSTLTTASSSTKSTSSALSTSSAPAPTAGAGNVQLGSSAALFVGMAGALAFL